MTSDSDVNFPQATADWGTIVAIGIHDASSSGNLLMYTNLDTSKAIASGDVLKVASGSLTVSLD